MTLDGTINRTGLLVLLAVIHRGLAVAPPPYRRQPSTGRAAHAGRGHRRSDRRPGHHLQAHLGAGDGAAYALLEGLFLGAISAMYETRFTGIVAQAVLLTFGTTIALLLAYKSRLIRATENFKLGSGRRPAASSCSTWRR
jgi:hypothetical protein